MTKILITAAVCMIICGTAFGVTSKVVRHKGAADLAKGKTKDVVISSEGAISLGPKAEVVADKFGEAWTINAFAATSDGDVYIGTSPNGEIFKYSGGELKKIYPVKAAEDAGKKEPNDTNSPQDTAKKSDANNPASKTADANSSAFRRHLKNEHVFALCVDAGGRVLAGISGDKCRLVRFTDDAAETIFEPNDAKYIFAIVPDEVGNIYVGTGAKGKIYRLNPFGKDAELIYTAADKNILSLAAGSDGMLYAGGDERGLVYRIDPSSKKAFVVYDSEQSDVVALAFDEEGNLYSAATAITAKTDRTAAPSPQAENLPGRPDTKAAAPNKPEGVTQLQVANTAKPATADEQAKIKASMQRPAVPPTASRIYKISKEGFVTDIFQETAVFFALAEKDKSLLLGTGNKGQLFSINIDDEKRKTLYEDKQSSQITAILPFGEMFYIGASNPAKLIKLSSRLAAEGTYTSDLIDAGQPAKWGKLQIDASIPAGASVQISARSGNVSDINDLTYSAWTEPVDINEPVELNVPQGRFCQYKFILKGRGESPVVREVSVPFVVPNLAPKVEAVNAVRVESPDKQGLFKINYKASDRNNDKLIYRIDMRQVGRTNWIKLKDDVEADSFDWDSRTVEDGRYEIKITASDQRSNSLSTKLEDSRISDVTVVDNMPPQIKVSSTAVKGKTAKIKFKLSDSLSAIGAASYTVDSNTDWNGALPIDLVYDTLGEDFEIVIDKLDAGQHVIAIRFSDAVNNTAYKTVEINVPEK